MSKYKNPSVKLERLPDSFIESCSNSSVEEQPEEKYEIQPIYAKTEEKKKKGSWFSKTERETGRLPRLAKKKVKSSSLKDVSEDENSVEQLNDMKDSDYEDSPNIIENSDTSDSNFSDKDSGSEFKPNHTSKGRKRKPTSKSKKAKGKQKTSEVKEITEYEKLVIKNKNEKMAFLESLKINEVKESFSDAVKSFRLTVRPKQIRKPRPPVVPRQKIARSSKVQINLSEEAFDARNRSKGLAYLREMEEKKTNVVVDLPHKLYLKSVLDTKCFGNESYELFLDDFRGLDQGCTEPIENYESGFNDMALLASRVKAFSYTEITALDIHPMREKTIIAVGSENGTMYLWNMADLEPYAFDLHSRGFSIMKFCPENPHLIMCCNKDGLLRRGDLVSNVYNKVTDNKDCTYFDFLDPETYLVGHKDGYVSVVDMRAPRRRKINHQCHDYMLRSVSVHPVNKNEFITPTITGWVRLWDLRKLQKKPVIEVCQSNKIVPLVSAIYSPLTGKSVLTATQYGEVCLCDTAAWSSPLGSRREMFFKIRISTTTRKPIFAAWQPRTDSIFAVGNKLYPRGISIYNGRNNIFNYSHECIKPQISFCTFHPSLPIIAAIGSSKVFPFADKNLKIEQEVESV